jgi:hypothetical protein
LFVKVKGTIKGAAFSYPFIVYPFSKIGFIPPSGGFGAAAYRPNSQGASPLRPCFPPHRVSADGGGNETANTDTIFDGECQWAYYVKRKRAFDNQY